MGAILASLEEEDHVRRRPHPTDGRQILFVLTAKGAEERRRHRVAKHDWLVAALSKLEPAERRTLMAAIPLIRRLGDESDRAV
jgi:DNA-binding MarR family transcriptional regulator